MAISLFSHQRMLLWHFSPLYPKDTVLITARGTVGKLALPAVDMAMNQSCYALKERNGFGQLFLFLTTQQQIDYLQKNTGGATFGTIIVDTFRGMQVLRPRMELAAKFEAQVRPLFDLTLNLANKNENLRQTRDLLLPRLISGELDVSELAIKTANENDK